MSDPNEKPPNIFDEPVPGEIPEDAPGEVPEEAPDAESQKFNEDPGSAGLSESITEDGHLKASVPVGDIDPYDHSDEEAARKADQEKLGTAPPELPETVDEPLRNPAMMQDTAAPLQEEMERRFSQEFGDLKVEVTAAERDAFVRAALHDEELIFTVQLEGVDASVEVAIPQDEFTNSASAAVKHWGKEDFIDAESDLQWLLAFQQMHAWYQVRSIDGVPTEWSDFWADGIPPIKDMRAAMRDTDIFEPFFRMNAARWRMLLEAVRISEMKYKICLQNWKDRSFFDGADTD